MNISITKKSTTESIIKIKIVPSDYLNKIDNKINEIKPKLNLKGFRPGKVPAQLIKKMYGKSILIEEINKLTSHELTNYIREKKINMIGEPVPDKSDETKINWEKETDFEFKFRIGMVSEFKLEKFSKSIKFNKYDIKIDKKIMNETIENLQNQFPVFVDIKEVKNDSIVEGKIINSKGYQKQNLKLFLKSLNQNEIKKILKKKIGNKVDLSLYKLCDSNIHQLNQMFQTNLKSINEFEDKIGFQIDKISTQKPSDINNELFEKVFGKGNIKNKTEFENKIKESIKSNYDRESEMLLNRSIQKQITNKHSISIPDEFLKNWIQKNNDKKSSDEIINKNYKNYCQELKWTFIVDKIVEKESIKVENNEIEEAAKNQIRYQLASSGIQNPEKELDKFVKSYLGQKNGDNYFKIQNQLKSDKAMNAIKKRISISNKNITFDKFKSLSIKELK